MGNIGFSIMGLLFCFAGLTAMIGDNIPLGLILLAIGVMFAGTGILII